MHVYMYMWCEDLYNYCLCEYRYMSCFRLTYTGPASARTTSHQRVSSSAESRDFYPDTDALLRLAEEVQSQNQQTQRATEDMMQSASRVCRVSCTPRVRLTSAQAHAG